MDDTNILGMSDEQFAELPIPDYSEESFEEPESVSDSGADEGVDEHPEPEYEQEEGEFDETTEEEENLDEEAEETSETDDLGSDEGDEEGESDETGQESSDVDYESFYKALTAPFKANGREMQVDNPEDAVRLMQMGANYNKKMSALKPNLKLMKMLDNNGLLSEDKLSFLIDLDKKNPDAIKKLVQDSGVETYALEEAGEYKPNTYSVDDKEFELDEVLDEIKHTDSYEKTLNVVTKVWDETSKRIIAENPQVLTAINEHISNGVFDQITAQIDKDKMLGRLSGLSDIEAYRQVGDRLFNQGNFNQENPPTQESPEPTQQPSPKAKQVARRKRAAATPRSASSASPKPTFNPLAMSDEDFEKEFSDSYIQQVTFLMPRQYNDPVGGTPSQIGVQHRTDHYVKKALIEAVKEEYFGQLASSKHMPKNMGKTMKLYHYLPLLDDRNINDQGIDAAGATIANGNLYGSSKDIGTITSKIPLLSETGGRVNRVGFRRIPIEGSLEKMGFFDEYTQESLDFDSDSELRMHVNREMTVGANQLTEAILQADILNAAGTVKFAGAAMDLNEVGPADLVTYDDLVKLGIDLDNNRTPKQSKVITGTRIIDTKVVSGGRPMYVPSELVPTLMAMKDYHGEKAFVEVKHYAASGQTLRGEVGSIAGFRIITPLEMQRYEGAGAAGNGTSYETGGNVDVFPMLVVGDESFATIGFQTDGKTVKFKIIHKPPGEETADRTDPYGETGFMAIKWYYGFLALRPERIARFMTAAKA